MNRVSFAVPRGSLFGLLGANGAGKTTLFSLVAGFLRPDAGNVRIFGHDARNTTALEGRLAILPQDAMLAANVPVFEQLVFFAQLGGATRHEADQQTRRSLELVGLSAAATKTADMLSHGMSKRVGLAQAFMGRPELILLDEPTAGLDPANAKAIRDLILEMQATVKATVVISSHMLREIQDMCDRVAVMHMGRLIQIGTMNEFTAGSVEVRLRLNKAPDDRLMAVVHGTAGVKSLSRNATGEMLIGLHDATAPGGRDRDEVVKEILGHALAEGYVPRTLQEGASLEAKFLELTAQAPQTTAAASGYRVIGR